jgi:hypothetical protein
VRDAVGGVDEVPTSVADAFPGSYAAAKSARALRIASGLMLRSVTNVP